MNIIDEIDKYLLSGEGRKRESHYASDVTACKRQLVYKWRGAEKSNPVDAGALWKMRMGDSIHSLIAEFLSSSGHDIMDEVSLKKDYSGLEHPVSMRADVIGEKNGEMFGVEVKSSYGAGIVAIQRANAPKYEHASQICMYADAYNVSKWYLIYIGRDNGYRTQFSFTYNNGALWQDSGNGCVVHKALIERLKDVEALVKSEQEPERDYVAAIKNGIVVDQFQKDGIKYRSAWQCLYCEYKDRCWSPVCKEYEGSNNSDMFKESTDEE